MGVWQEEPVASLWDIAMSLLFPDKIYSLGGAEEISMAVTGSCLPIGFSLRNLTGSIPLAKEWLGTCGFGPSLSVAPASVC